MQNLDIDGEARLAPAIGPSVLLVDDEENVLRLIAFLLRLEGFHVTSASDGPEALERMREMTSLDILILDVILPGMSGPQVAQAVRCRFPEVGVLFVSGYLDAENRLAGDAFLQKPFRNAQLLEAVNGLPCQAA